MSRARSKGWTAALLLSGIVGGLVLGEIASHLLWGTCSLRIRTGVASETDVERRRGSRHDEDGVPSTFDADGFRAEESPAAFDRTILFVGDSFTEGYGVVDGASFPAQTGLALARRGIPVRSLNAGDSGAGAAQEFRLLRLLLGERKVDGVVLQVFPHNDLEDNWQDGGFTVVDGKLVAVSPPRPPAHIAWGKWLADNRVLGQVNVVRLLANLFPPLNPPPMEATDDAVQLERLLLQETVSAAHAARIPILIFVVAEQHECEHRTQGPPVHAYERVLAVVEGLGVPFVTSCDVTRDHYNHSGHFDAAGNALIGEVLADRLAPLLDATERANAPDRPAGGHLTDAGDAAPQR
jgi:lysophospholipase L1-like esterase